MTQTEKKEALDLLLNMLSIPTVNNYDREEDLAIFLKNYFNKYGIDSTIQKVDEKRSNIIAIVDGVETDTKVIWNGHLDTVPLGSLDLWNTDPASPTLLDNRIYGRGTSDMKSGLAAMVYALCNMKQKGIIPPYSIQFIGTCDEESGGAGASKIMEESLLGNPEYILIGEPTDGDIGLAQKGCLWIRLSIKGVSSHAAYPEQGFNAIQKGFNLGSRISKALQCYKHPLYSGSSAEITMIEGGTVMNVVPDLCTMGMDIRFVPTLKTNEVLTLVEDICKNFEQEYNGKISIRLEVLNNRPSIETSDEDKWVKQLSDLIRQRGKKAERFGINYFTDASILKRTEIPIILFGPGKQELCHKPNEYVETDRYFFVISVLKDLYCCRIAE